MLYGLVFGGLKTARMAAFFSYEPEDEALHEQVMWNTAHGRLFQQTLWHQTYELHLRPVLLALAPVYALRAAPGTLAFLYAFLIGAGAVGVFLWTRERWGDNAAAFWAAVVYLLYPPLHFLAWNLSDSCVLGAPLVFFGLYAIESRKAGLFHVVQVLLFLCREDMALTATMMGVYAAMRRRGVWWWAPYLVAGPAYAWVALKVVFPAWVGQGGYVASTRLALSLKDLAEVSRDPVLALAKLAALPGKPAALLLIFAPLLFLPLLRPAALVIGLASLAQMWLWKATWMSPNAHHATGLVAAALAAGLMGAETVARWAASKGGAKGRPALALRGALWLLAAAGVLANLAPNRLGAVFEPTVADRDRAYIQNIYAPALYRRSADDRAAMDMIELVPPNAPLAATGHLLPWVANRAVVVHYPPKHEAGAGRLGQVWGILVDKRLLHAGGGGYPVLDADPTDNARLLDKAKAAFLARGWELAGEERSCFLLRRKVAGGCR
ncbi:MAG TPA: DUF2079 domain-containing protein [Candidatus Brocadiia bacterium]|nr:DUF2079 domain-containing protein [Candidatus Brocadiia bacterium]